MIIVMMIDRLIIFGRLAFDAGDARFFQKKLIPQQVPIEVSILQLQLVDERIESHIVGIVTLLSVYFCNLGLVLCPVISTRPDSVIAFSGNRWNLDVDFGRHGPTVLTCYYP